MRSWTMARLPNTFFGCRMDDIIGQMLLVEEDHFPLLDFISYSLGVCGSSQWHSFRKRINSDSLEPVPSSQTSPCLLQIRSLNSQPREPWDYWKIFPQGSSDDT